MKQRTQSLLHSIISDGWLTGLTIVNILVMIIVIVAIAVMIEPRETQVITQYSAFGITGFYLGYWYNLWSYVAFEIILVVGNSLLSAKLAQLNRRDLSLALLWLTIGLSVVALLIARSIIKIATLG